MPRQARIKYSGAIYHIMCRSVSEILLFRDDSDKDYYLYLLKKYSDVYKCSIFAYCLMSNHLHIHMDPNGYDISKFMHGLNTAYVCYYNKKYGRRGHLLQERFLSKIVDSDHYNLAVSAYIHNNPKDVEGYAGRVSEYKYSSYGIYLGLRKDKLRLVDKSFIFGLFGISSIKRFVQQYYSFVKGMNNLSDIVDISERIRDNMESISVKDCISDRKTILRDIDPKKAIAYISCKLKLSIKELSLQCEEKQANFRAFTAYVLRVLCGLGYKQICDIICNLSMSGCSKIFMKGYCLLGRQELSYRNIFSDLQNYTPI